MPWEDVLIGGDKVESSDVENPEIKALLSLQMHVVTEQSRSRPMQCNSLQLIMLYVVTAMRTATFSSRGWEGTKELF